MREIDIIRAEIVNDPARVGYISRAAANAPERTQSRSEARGAVIRDAVEKLNTLGAGTVPRGPVSAVDFVAAAGDVSGLIGDATSRYQVLLTYAGAGVLNLSLPVNISLVDQAFSGPSRAAQNAAIKALANRAGSRAEILIGRAVTELDVAIALWGDDR